MRPSKRFRERTDFLKAPGQSKRSHDSNLWKPESVYTACLLEVKVLKRRLVVRWGRTLTGLSLPRTDTDSQK
jgi:hypothetical protein